MWPIFKLIVILSSLPFMINAQTKICPTPLQQRPTIPYYDNDVVRVNIDRRFDVLVIRVYLPVAQEQPSLPILESNSEGQRLGYTAYLWLSLTEAFAFTDNRLFQLTSSTNTQLVTDHFNFPTNTFDVVASTRTNNSIVLIVKDPSNGQVTKAVFGLTRMNGKFQLISQLPFINTNSTPDAITAFENKYEQFVVFSGNFWTIISSDQLNQLHSLELLNTNQLRLSRTWVGCPVELCFESDLDAAVNLDGQIVIYRGQYSWKLNIAAQLITIQDIPNDLIYYMDAAFVWSSSYNFIVENRIVSGNVVYSGGFASSRTDFQISAAFVHGATVFMLSGTRFNEYNVISGTLNQQKTGKVGDKWSGLPDYIDAAVELTGQNEVIFFKGSYHYKGNITGGPVVPSLTMNTLYQCTDTFYSVFTSGIGIDTFTDFETYIKRYQPAVNYRPATPDVTSSSTNAIVIVVVIIVAVSALVASYLLMKVPSRKKRDSLVEVLFEESTTESLHTLETTGFVPRPKVADGSIGLKTVDESTSINTTARKGTMLLTHQ